MRRNATPEEIAADLKEQRERKKRKCERDVPLTREQRAMLKAFRGETLSAHELALVDRMYRRSARPR